MRRERSLESGLKYLIIGSVGSATLLYGLAMIYGATGATGFTAIAGALASGNLASDPLTLTGIALCVAGLCFKASVAPFHQWTPDVYEGAPTPVTAFMAVATKAAALGVFLRLFDVALISAQSDWGPALAVLATITILAGNAGALGQSSLKRMLAYSSVAQAGYMLAGVVVASKLGIQATVFYLAVYVAMNMASFAVIVAREREMKNPTHPNPIRPGGLDRRHGRSRPRASVACVADDDLDARPRRNPRDGGVHRQVLFDRRRRLRRLHLAGSGDRGRLDDLARLLPAGDRSDVDA
jgi:proton-translocating NADH-quinone oxidoreductase chain N